MRRLVEPYHAPLKGYRVEVLSFLLLRLTLATSARLLRNAHLLNHVPNLATLGLIGGHIDNCRPPNEFVGITTPPFTYPGGEVQLSEVGVRTSCERRVRRDLEGLICFSVALELDIWVYGFLRGLHLEDPGDL